MSKEKQETESEIINETDTTTELTVENQGKELITQTNLSSSNLFPLKILFRFLFVFG